MNKTLLNVKYFLKKNSSDGLFFCFKSKNFEMLFWSVSLDGIDILVLFIHRFFLTYISV
jgi:hypothetical protein